MSYLKMMQHSGKGKQAKCSPLPPHAFEINKKPNGFKSHKLSYNFQQAF